MVVIAGAGTGKTLVLTERVLHLLDLGVAPDRIMCLTFTNAAADEMLERIQTKASRRLPDVRTLHSWCARLLQADPYAVGRVPGFTIYDDVDRMAILRMCGEDCAVKGAATARSETLTKNPQVLAAYEHRLQQSNAVDYDALEKMALYALQTGATEFAKHYQHILVDEAQDLSPLQYEILEQLDAATRFYVGDPRQAIYGFRGASPAVWQTMVDATLSDDGNSTGLYHLTVNHRSLDPVVVVANAIASPMGLPDLVADRADVLGKARTSYRAADPEDNAIIDALRTMREDGLSPGGIAVLGRRWRDLWRVQKLLQSLNIPHRYRGRKWSPWDSPDGRNLARLLLLSTNLSDDNMVALVARHYGMTGAGLLHHRSEAQRRRVPLMHVLADTDEAMANLVHLCASIEDTTETAGLAREMLATTETDEDWRLRKCLDTLDDPRRARMGTFRAWWAFGRAPQDRVRADQVDAVQLLTVHGSKGLEFDGVVVVNCADGVYPTRRAASTPADEAEDLRVLYVAATRARDQLALTCPSLSPRRGRPPVPMPRSPFLDPAMNLLTPGEPRGL